MPTHEKPKEFRKPERRWPTKLARIQIHVSDPEGLKHVGVRGYNVLQISKRGLSPAPLTTPSTREVEEEFIKKAKNFGVSSNRSKMPSLQLKERVGKDIIAHTVVETGKGKAFVAEWTRKHLDSETDRRSGVERLVVFNDHPEIYQKVLEKEGIEGVLKLLEAHNKGRTLWEKLIKPRIDRTKRNTLVKL
ncbi:MAG: hypothetical protein J7L23_00930 [Candidatus Diapherotrites archaeon]|nr:hypothetical protein [Candidatus Diapherotrites archaeon]